MRTGALTIAGAPVLVASATDPGSAARRGTVLLYHGLSADSVVQEPELRRIAEAGFLAIGVDAVGHGRRRYPDFEARFPAEGGSVAEGSFLQAVRATAEELPELIDALEERGWAQRVGLSGISMGGFICYRAATFEGRLKAVVPFLATPQWPGEPLDSPHRVEERFFPIALLSITGGRDEVVDTASTRAFHQRLTPRYASVPERLRYVEYAESGHMMREEDWNAGWTSALEWFDRFL